MVMPKMRNNFTGGGNEPKNNENFHTKSTIDTSYLLSIRIVGIVAFIHFIYIIKITIG